MVVADLDADAAAAVAAEIGRTRTSRSAVAVDVTDAEPGRRRRFDAAVLAFGGRRPRGQQRRACRISKPLLETTVEDWDLQHDVMARGSFLVSREAARVMIDQGMGGDIVYIASKNAVFAGPNNVAYGATKADQAHQVRLLAAELGEHGIRVNGDQPRRGRARLGHLRRRLGRRSAPRSTGCPRRSSASSTPSAPCSSGRCCPSTSPPPSSR